MIKSPLRASSIRGIEAAPNGTRASHYAVPVDDIVVVVPAAKTGGLDSAEGGHWTTGR